MLAVFGRSGEAKVDQSFCSTMEGKTLHTYCLDLICLCPLSVTHLPLSLNPFLVTGINFICNLSHLPRPHSYPHLPLSLHLLPLSPVAPFSFTLNCLPSIVIFYFLTFMNCSLPVLSHLSLPPSLFLQSFCSYTLSYSPPSL